MNRKNLLRVLVAIALLALCLAPEARGASAAQSVLPASSASAPSIAPLDPDAALLQPDDLAIGAAGDESGPRLFGEERMSSAVEIAVLLTLLSLLPGILVAVSSFTRIVIVLSFVRRALSTNDLPPTQVVLGLALFLTAFIMAPVANRIHASAWEPYQEGRIDAEEAGDVAWGELRGFLLANTRRSELALFGDIAEWKPDAATPDEPPPMRVVVPAFVLSELKTAFQMGFLLFLPFLVIDLIVSSVLLSMGMFMLPPVMVSTPLKILLFVLVDGWHLICESLVTSFTSV